MKPPRKLKKLLTSLGVSSLASLAGAGVVAMDQLSGPDQYSTEYDLTRSIDAVIAPSAAALVGQYAALEHNGTSLSDTQASIRADLTSRYRGIRSAAHQGGTFEQLATFEADGYRAGMSGHLSAEDVTGHASIVLRADQQIKTYAQNTQTALGVLGLDSGLAQSVTAGMIGTELLSTDFTQDVTPEGFIASSPFGDDVKGHLKASLPELWEPFDVVNEANSISYLKLQSRLQDAAPEAPAITQRTAAVSLAEQRPTARPDPEDRSQRIKRQLQARLKAEEKPDPRTSRVQQQALAVAASRRPVSRPSNGPAEAEI